MCSSFVTNIRVKLSVLLYYTLSTLFLYSSRQTLKGNALQSHPPVTEKETPLGEGQGLTTVTRLDAEGGNADPAGGQGSVPQQLRLREAGKQRRRRQGQAPGALPSTSASASGRGPRPPSVPRPTSGHRGPRRRSRPRRCTPPTATQASPVAPPGPGAGSSRGVRRETARHLRCGQRSELQPPEGRSHVDGNSALIDGE